MASDKLKCILHMSMMTTTPDIDTEDSGQFVYSISSECGRCYIGSTGRLLEVCVYQGIWKEITLGKVWWRD